MAVKIRLKRMGKIRTPYYRVVVVDSRKKRDGRVIEEIGKYHPKEEPSLIEVTSDRAQYWLGVGAQPTEAVAALLKVTGDWQKFKGLPGTEGTLKVAEPKQTKADVFNEALKEAGSEAAADAVPEEGRQEGGRRRPPRPRPPPRHRAASRDPRRRDARGRHRGCRGRGGQGRRRPRSRPTTSPRRTDAVLADALEHLVRGIVRHPDDVTVRDKQLRRGSVLEVRVHPEDLGKVIGRGGRTATALRTVVGALAGKGGARVDFVDVDRRR